MRYLTAAFLTVFGTAAVAQDCVVMLHGLARTEISFTAMQLMLENEGYAVVNRGYPSTEETIQTLVEEHLAEDVAACGAARVHFVTHSMGGILARWDHPMGGRSWLISLVILNHSNGSMDLPDCNWEPRMIACLTSLACRYMRLGSLRETAR